MLPPKYLVSVPAFVPLFVHHHVLVKTNITWFYIVSLLVSQWYFSNTLTELILCSTVVYIHKNKKSFSFALKSSVLKSFSEARLQAHSEAAFSPPPISKERTREASHTLSRQFTNPSSTHRSDRNTYSKDRYKIVREYYPKNAKKRGGKPGS